MLVANFLIFFAEVAFVLMASDVYKRQVLMNTTKGKGVSYMENQVGWHGKAPNDEEYKLSLIHI